MAIPRCRTCSRSSTRGLVVAELELALKDSNLNFQSQNLACYHCTKGEYLLKDPLDIEKLPYSIKSAKSPGLYLFVDFT